MLQDLASAVTLPGLPEWTGLVALVVLLLVGLAYLLMPFAVFGVKGRLDAIEAQLDEIQTEIRTLALRLPEPSRGRRPPVEEDWAEPPMVARRADPAPPPRSAPPVPPPAAWPERGAGRSEPRVEWPRPPR
ncbi:hypothetical protein DFH01_18305 [Falsiroseomonas bella]|uniref:Uncharacterized protein n=1 Tax=Falsiroseomonas bella TaxID=2184016 RepID=A0A317F8S8_9PROT|nr:hypothetical protein [Falsiroseomonas bella]PWS35551.1 hypothetical protein DFH01_18305 [Falsiroseomonas bella]